MSKRWEMGSEFHWEEGGGGHESSDRWRPSGVLTGSGRDALRLLVDHGRRVRGWKRLLVPTFFCQEVVSSLKSTGIEVESYPDSPLVLEPALPKLAYDSAVLWVNYFGLRKNVPQVRPEGADWIEDHTHDPWSELANSSSADYCVASLRKTLPIPEGGCLWSPRGHRLPHAPSVSPQRASASAEKLMGMVLKRAYLRGGDVSKSVFRRFMIRGEDQIASGAISGMTPFTSELLSIFPVGLWRSRRAANYRVATELLCDIDWLQVLTPSCEWACPFSIVVVLDKAMRRDFLRERLIAQRIYPAVLWSLESAVVAVRHEDLELSRRMLSLHCDMRYGADDMSKLASAIRQLGAEFRNE